MLVISRRVDTEVYFDTSDGRITVKFLRVLGPDIRIGIDAPRSVIITRDDMKIAPEANEDENENHMVQG